MSIDQAVRKMLFDKDYFYGYFLSQLNRRPTYDIPTAAIELRESGASLLWNPDFWGKLSIDGQVAVLQHEVGHFILNHITIGRELGVMGNHQLFNVAADLAVNSMIPKFPNKGMVPIYERDEKGKRGELKEFKESEFATVANFKKMYPKIEEAKSFKWYLEFLQQEGYAQNQGKCDGSCQPGQPGDGGHDPGNHQPGCGGHKHQFDDHSKWGGDIPKDVADQIAKQMVGRAMDEASTVGSLESMDPRLREILKGLLKPHNSWARELRRFPQDAMTVTLESSRKRINKRYGTVYPGFKKERKVRIGVGFDVSGSMWDDLTVKRLMNELSIIHKDADLYVMFFDTDITKECEFESELQIKQIPGGGGTCFQPVLTRAAELKLDGLIMLTDGMNADTMSKPRFPVLWGILEEYDYKPEFGKVIKIPSPEKKGA